jgi:hypothetical protein
VYDGNSLSAVILSIANPPRKTNCLRISIIQFDLAGSFGDVHGIPLILGFASCVLVVCWGSVLTRSVAIDPAGEHHRAEHSPGSFDIPD